MCQLLRLISAGVLALAACVAIGVAAQEPSRSAHERGSTTARDSCESPQLLEVSFSGGTDIRVDDDSDSYGSPHWMVGSRSYPYLMQAEKTLVIGSAKLRIPCPFTMLPLVRGVQEEGFNVPPTQLSNIDGSAYEIRDVPVTRAFRKAVSFSDAFKIDWQVSLDGGLTWDNAGTSTNPIYVCLGTASHPLRTVVHAACSWGGPLTQGVP